MKVVYFSSIIRRLLQKNPHLPLKGKWGHNNKEDSVRYISLAYPVRTKSARKFSGVSVAIFSPDCTM